MNADKFDILSTDQPRAVRREVEISMPPSSTENRVFEFDANGLVILHSYSTAEISDLLEIYRAHMAAMGELARNADSFRYVPQGPEDV